MKRILSASVLLVLLGLTAFAQLSTNTLTGSVSGPDGVLPGATVTVRDNRTAKEITVTTGDDGVFRVPNLEVGLYTVTVTAAGFKTYTAEQVQIEIGKTYDLAVPLEVGGVNETVTVTAGTDIVNSTDAQQNGIISNRQLEELPLLTRNPLGFVPLQAGVASNPAQLSTINGIRTSATNITIEGVNVQDNFIRANATDFSPARPLVDEVEEFTVTGQANVDRGFGAGQIQFPIRRGGNEYRGSLFAYNRNSEFAANTFFNNAAATPTNPEGIRRPFRNRNEFGGRIGGPLPFLNFGEGGPVTRSGKDKLFFFFFYQKTIDIIPANDLVTTLTNNARSGLFTYTAGCTLPFDPNNTTNPNRCPQGITPGQAVTVNIFNPALGTGITGINPLIASQFLSRIPTGNSTDTGDGRVTTGFRFQQASNAEQTNYATRIDYNVNDRTSVKGIFRYVYQDVQRSDVDTSFNTQPLVDQPSANPFFSAGVTSSFSDNFSNEIQGGIYTSDPTFVRNQASPSLFIVPTLITNPDVTFLNQGRTTKAVNLQDNATLQLGSHGLRFGGQFQAIRINAFNDAATVPTFSLGVGGTGATATPQITPAQFTNNALFPGTVPTTQRAGANALLALLGGIVTQGTQTFNVTSQNSGFIPGATNARRFESEIYGLYAADQWRVRPNLTLNFGLRYDVYTALRNPEGLFLEPVIADGQDPVQAILDPNGRYQFIGGNAGAENAFFKTDKNNFAPNVSFAYTPGFNNFLFGENKTVIRGGYRISYINDEFVASANNAGVGNAGLSTGITAQFNGRVNNLPTFATPVFDPDRTYLENNIATGFNFGTVYAIDPDIQTPMIQEYSLGFQRELGFDTAFEVRYVGTRSTNLLRAIDANQIDIRGNGFLADFNRARANFVLTGNPGCTTAGCQALTVFPRLASGGFLTNATVQANLQNGTPADLALFYIQNGVTGTVPFLPNPNTGVADLLGNFGSFNYNSLQVEVRRRFAQGFQLQGNYTFSKNLTNSQGAQTNATGDTQNRFDPLLDNLNPSLEESRAITDQTHKFNLNAVYELPFGRGRRFLSEGILGSIFGNFTLSGIFQIGSGAPITFTDPRGTLNRAARSNRQTALTNLTKEELKELTGVFRTENGVFFINPTALGRDPVTGLLLTGRTGQGISGNFDQAPFAGQVFFRNAPGQTSGLERAIVDGPTFYNLDLTLIKRFTFGERYSFQVQADAFNVFNTTNFTVAQFQDINSTNFGRITGTFAPRVLQLSGRFNF